MGSRAVVDEEVREVVRLNRRDNLAEEVMRLRALQDISALRSETLLALSAVVAKLQQEGSLERHIELYCEGLFEEQWPPHQRRFTAFT